MRTEEDKWINILPSFDLKYKIENMSRKTKGRVQKCEDTLTGAEPLSGKCDSIKLR
jgi:hypothetical protein